MAAGRPLDEVYRILKLRGEPMHYRDLMAAGAWDPASAARIYTEMNLDVRFAHLGDGKWGLSEWTAKAVPRVVSPDVQGVLPRRSRTLEWPDCPDPDDEQPEPEGDEDGCLDWEEA